jgi:hypothetical protein
VGHIATLHLEVFSTASHPEGRVFVYADRITRGIVLLSGSTYSDTVEVDVPFVENQTNVLDVPFCVLRPGVNAIVISVTRPYVKSQDGGYFPPGDDTRQLLIESSLTSGSSMTTLVRRTRTPVPPGTTPLPEPNSIPPSQCSAGP